MNEEARIQKRIAFYSKVYSPKPVNGKEGMTTMNDSLVTIRTERQLGRLRTQPIRTGDNKSGAINSAAMIRMPHSLN